MFWQGARAPLFRFITSVWLTFLLACRHFALLHFEHRFRVAKKSCGYADITREEGLMYEVSEEGLVVKHTVSTNVKRIMQSTS